MGSPEQIKTQEETMLRRIADTIENSSQAIENEWERTGACNERPNGNSWFACYNTRLMLLGGLIEEAVEFLDTDKIFFMRNKLREAIDESERVRSNYFDRFSSPPDDVKKGLLQKLNILADDDLDELVQESI